MTCIRYSTIAVIKTWHKIMTLRVLLWYVPEEIDTSPVNLKTDNNEDTGTERLRLLSVTVREHEIQRITKTGRQGAVAEADDLQQALQTSGCDVIKMEWSDAAELHNMIESALSRIINDCSLLVVCLMSHGSRGVLSDSNGKTIPVNDILHQLKQFPPTLDIPIPIVSTLKSGL